MTPLWRNGLFIGHISKRIGYRLIKSHMYNVLAGLKQMSEIITTWSHIAGITIVLCAAVGSNAAWASPLSADDELMRHQQIQQRARDTQLSPPEPDIHFGVDRRDTGSAKEPNESPCFMVRRVYIDNAEQLPGWAVRELQRASEPVLNQCLGSKGINLLNGAFAGSSD